MEFEQWLQHLKTKYGSFGRENPNLPIAIAHMSWDKAKSKDEEDLNQAELELRGNKLPNELAETIGLNESKTDTVFLHPTDNLLYSVNKEDPTNVFTERVTSFDETFGESRKGILAGLKYDPEGVSSRVQNRAKGEILPPIIEEDPNKSSVNKQAAKVVSKPANKSTEYIVKSGDNLSKIAKETGINVKDLRSINKIKGNLIKPGQKLSLDKSNLPFDTDKEVFDQVRKFDKSIPGATIGGVSEDIKAYAERQGVDVKDLFNKLKDRQVFRNKLPNSNELFRKLDKIYKPQDVLYRDAFGALGRVNSVEDIPSTDVNSIQTSSEVDKVLKLISPNINNKFKNKDTRDRTKLFFKRFGDQAIQLEKDSGIPASVTLAQAILESNWGRSSLSKVNNFFGVKYPFSRKDGKVIPKGGKEGVDYVVRGDDYADDVFKVYDSPEASFEHRGEFLQKDRYNFLHDIDLSKKIVDFSIPKDVKGYKEITFNGKKYKAGKTYKLSPTNAWVVGLKMAGYATDPKYASTLSKLIKDYNLTKFNQKFLKREEKEELNLESQPGFIGPIMNDISSLKKKDMGGPLSLGLNLVGNKVVEAISRGIDEKNQLQQLDSHFNNVQQNNPYQILQGGGNLKTEESRQWMLDWFSNSITKNRLNDRPAQFRAIKGIENVDVNIKSEDEFTKDQVKAFGRGFRNSPGLHNPGTNEISIVEGLFNLPLSEEAVMVHELTHASGLDKEKYNTESINKEFGTKFKGNHETYPRLMELRRLLKVSPGDPINPKMIERYKGNYNVDRLLNEATSSQLSMILNRIANVDTGGDKNVVQTGGELVPTRAYGGSLYKSENEIKDYSYNFGGQLNGISKEDFQLWNGPVHEEHPGGGIPVDQEGVLDPNSENLIEGGEVIVNGYAFSNRLRL